MATHVKDLEAERDEWSANVAKADAEIATLEQYLAEVAPDAAPVAAGFATVTLVAQDSQTEVQTDDGGHNLHGYLHLKPEQVAEVIADEEAEAVAYASLEAEEHSPSVSKTDI